MFEPITKGWRYDTALRVTLAQGSWRLSKHARDTLGITSGVVVLIDRERRLLAFRAASPDDPAEIIYHLSSPTSNFTCKAALTFAGKGSRAWEARLEDGLLVINVDEPLP